MIPVSVMSNDKQSEGAKCSAANTLMCHFPSLLCATWNELCIGFGQWCVDLRIGSCVFLCKHERVHHDNRHNQSCRVRRATRNDSNQRIHE